MWEGVKLGQNMKKMCMRYVAKVKEAGNPKKEVPFYL